jgi:hypothetical protein
MKRGQPSRAFLITAWLASLNASTISSSAFLPSGRPARLMKTRIARLSWLDLRIVAVLQHLNPRDRVRGEERPHLLLDAVSRGFAHVILHELLATLILLVQEV